ALTGSLARGPLARIGDDYRSSVDPVVWHVLFAVISLLRRSDNPACAGHERLIEQRFGSPSPSSCVRGDCACALCLLARWIPAGDRPRPAEGELRDGRVRRSASPAPGAVRGFRAVAAVRRERVQLGYCRG